MILQCCLLFAFLALGELIVYLTKIPIPSSIIGMILLTVALKLGIIKEQWISKIADFLVKNIAFFFVPAGVGLLKCLNVLQAEWKAIVIAMILSTILVIAATGWAHQLTRKISKKYGRISRK